MDGVERGRGDWVLKVILLLQAKEIYVLCENFMYTGLSPVLSPCYFILTLATLISPALYSFAMASAEISLLTIASAAPW